MVLALFGFTGRNKVIENKLHTNYTKFMMHWNLDYKNHNRRQYVFLGLFCLSAIDVIFAFEPSHILPCDYSDSINITNGILQPNKSYIFNGVEYGQGHYAKIDYTIYNDKIIPQRPYIRGCLCNVKHCIRLCCPYGSYLEIKNSAGICRRHEAAKYIEGEIINQNNETQRIKFHEHFAILHKYPCQDVHLPGEDYAITHVSCFFLQRSKNSQIVFINSKKKTILRKAMLFHKIKHSNNTNIV